jgi:hypothetical protein
MRHSAVRRGARREATPRHGIALVSTLGLLALAAALLAGAFASATASARATRSARASIVAHAAARRALARAVMAWSATEDSLPIGAFIMRVPPDSAPILIDAADTRLRVQRLSPTMFLVAVDAIVPASGAALARRRARVLLERPRSPDSTIVLPPRPITRWASADLF